MTEETKIRIHRSVRRWMVDALLIVLLVGGVMWWQGRSLLASQELVPQYTLRSLSGELVDFKPASGKPSIVYFFAPWCTVCKYSAGNLETIQNWLGTERLDVVAIALDFESAASVREFAGEYMGNTPVLLGGREIAEGFKVSAYPTYYVIDESGRVANGTVGFSTLLGLLARVLIFGGAS